MLQTFGQTVVALGQTVVLLHQPVILGDVRPCIDDTFEAYLTQSNGQTSTQREHIVTETAGSAYGIEVLHRGHSTEFGREVQSVGKVVAGFQSVGKGEGMAATYMTSYTVGVPVRVVRHTDTQERYYVPP